MCFVMRSVQFWTLVPRTAGQR
eukprot:SAG11_NODE_2858_length_2900_cov_1.881471_1_plen_21_part_10